MYGSCVDTWMHPLFMVYSERRCGILREQMGLPPPVMMVPTYAHTPYPAAQRHTHTEQTNKLISKSSTRVFACVLGG